MLCVRCVVLCCPASCILYSILTADEVEDGAGKHKLVLGCDPAADVSALHAGEAEHHAEEAEGQATHQEASDALNIRCRRGSMEEV